MRLLTFGVTLEDEAPPPRRAREELEESSRRTKKIGESTKRTSVGSKIRVKRNNSMNDGDP